MVFNATFNNILAISWHDQFYWWRKPEYPEKSRPVASHRHTLSHNVVSSTPLHVRTGFELTTLVKTGTDCIGSGKSNYHMITTMTPSMKQRTTTLDKSMLTITQHM